jgi:tripartite ATP-independent transporter DctP family solute receptor
MKIRIHRLLPLAICLLILMISSDSCRFTKHQKVLKLAHILDPTHSVHKAMVYMAGQLEKKSGGKLTIQIYPSGQLGKERECLELLQIGSLAITKVSAAVMEGFVEDYKVLGMPYLFENKEHIFKVLDSGIGKKLLLSGEHIWLRGLCFYDAGSRSFYTRDKPIYTPDDLKGLEIRVMESITADNMVKAMGANPTRVDFGELYTALQTGVVDGAENNPPSFYLSRHYEVCKYYSLDEHTSIPDVVLISKIIWDKLSEQEKKWVQEAADESVIYQRKLWYDSEQEALEGVKKAGVQIIIPDKKPFVEKVQPLYEKMKSNKRLYNLIKEIKAEAPKSVKDENKNIN